MGIKVEAVQCPICDDIIYSCARHDYHSCTCGNCDIDGGFDYLKYGWTNVKPVQIEIEVDATKEELYNSWNNSSLEGPRKYGKITRKKV